MAGAGVIAQSVDGHTQQEEALLNLLVGVRVELGGEVWCDFQP